MSDHVSRLAEIEKTNLRSLAWKQVVLWSTGGAVVLLLGFSATLYYYFQSELTPLLLGAAAATVAILLFLLLVTIGNTLTVIHLIRKDSALMELRFDVYAAVESALLQTLHRHLPNYTRLHTELDVGEELHRRAKHVSKRSAELAQKLITIYAGKSLAEAVDLMVKDSLLAHGLAADNAAVAAFLEKVGDNIVPIRHAGE